jgi:hypothetical protein
MDTNLIGYLLGNLDADSQRAVEARLRTDPRLRAELGRVRRRLDPLSALRSPAPSPPPGLARRTLARLAAHRRLPDAPPLSPAQRAEARAFGPRRANLLVPVLAVGFVLACVLPWLAACRNEARVHGGQNNLAEAWVNLRCQADAATAHALPENVIPTANFLAEPLSDRLPLLMEHLDQADAGPPACDRLNLLFVGGYVQSCDQATMERLISSPTPPAEQTPWFAP